MDAVKQLVSPSVLQEIAKAAFTITGEKFVQSLDREAVNNPKKYHHIYEWGRLGSPDGRLFVLERESILSGILEINTSFLQSSVPVPTKAGFDKSISSNDIFRYKASVMEKGAPISYVTSRIQTFLGYDGQAFIAPGTKITILNPGGVATKNAFSDFMVNWYLEHTNSIMDSSGLYEKIALGTAAVLSLDKTGVSEVRRAVASVVDSMGGNLEVIK